jgi:hypothetical protein
MRIITWLFAILLIPALAEAQASEASFPHWDFNVSVAQFNANPDRHEAAYDDWYATGRVAASIGYYWSENLRTEIEYANTGEGTIFLQEFIRLPNGQSYPVSLEESHHLQQAAIRVVWQFFDNRWVHPYVNVGAVVDINRRQYDLAGAYYPVDPRIVPPQIVRDRYPSGSVVDYGAGVSYGGGVKFFVSQKAYLNTGMQFTYGDRFKTAAFLAGFGFEF